ncbi:DUF6520 family protein [Empedobacter sp. UBA7248]|uniref:DUF6520 family protein n=1 Tax=Empedobacter sp. UBA7248 TaxID=1946448 RepID=UPI0025BA563B|nr:DUF6520 family protein [Empedobacter sp. UBA7248]
MKTNFKQIILPAVIIMMGTGAAFATNQVKQKENKRAPKMGYIYNTTLNTCVPIRECSDIPNDICTIDDNEDSQQVFGLKNTGDLNTCNVTLYKP